MEIHEAGIADLQALLESGELAATAIVEALLDRIASLDRQGPELRSIIELNPHALEIADALDREGKASARRSLHGVPVLLKDNIDTADAMHTTAGSLALFHSMPRRDAFVVSRLRRAGAIPLGKVNMSEWANFRSTHSTSGWSARGGQALNPYALDRSPCGSSSGSASAVAAGLAPISIGTETDGSILCPASMCGTVGIKPTVGLTSRSGVVPISHTQDTVGPFGRSVHDAALLLSLMTGEDPRDPATRLPGRPPSISYETLLDRGALQGSRIGVARDVYFGYSPKADAIAEEAIAVMRMAGAEIVDPANIPTAKQMADGDREFTVLLYEFKAGLAKYLRGREGDGPATLRQIIEFNVAHASEELCYFGQEAMILAQEKGPLTEPEYLEALEENQRASRGAGIDAVMEEHRLDALVMPTAGPADMIDPVNGDHFAGSSSSPAALAGYPAVTVNAGYAFGLPVGITFMGRAFSESVLIRLAFAYEQLSGEWRPPTFPPTVTL